MGRHKAVSHRAGINFRIIFVKDFEFFNESIKGFGVVLSDIKLNPGGVKGKDLGQFGIYHVADRFRIVHHLFKHEFNIRLKVLFEPGHKRSIRHFGKATELPEFPAKSEEKEQKGIRGDGKDFLKDEGGKETFKRIISLSVKMLVKGIAENGRDEFGDIKILIKELEERGNIIKKRVQTIRENIF